METETSVEREVERLNCLHMTSVVCCITKGTLENAHESKGLKKSPQEQESKR